MATMRKPTIAYGYEIVLGIMWESRSPTRAPTHEQWDDNETREELTRALHRSLENPDDVEHLEVEPGYVRLRVKPSDDAVAPGDVLGQVRRSRACYNSEVDDHLAGLEFSEEHIGTYSPDGSTTLQTFVEMHGADGELEKPISRFERDQDAGDGLAFEYAVPIDPETYETVHNGPRPFEWDDWAKEKLENAFGRQSKWPSGQIELLEVWPGHMRIVHRGAAPGHAPARHARQSADAIGRAFVSRPLRESENGGQFRQPPLTLERSVYIGPVDDGSGAEEFLEEHGLGEIEPEAEPEPEPEPEIDLENKGDVWDRLNPFGGA